jgi:hypothetical protein
MDLPVEKVSGFHRRTVFVVALKKSIIQEEVSLHGQPHSAGFRGHDLGCNLVGLIQQPPPLCIIVDNIAENTMGGAPKLDPLTELPCR